MKSVNQFGFEINNLLETSDKELMKSSLNKLDKNISIIVIFNPLKTSFNKMSKTLKSTYQKKMRNGKHISLHYIGMEKTTNIICGFLVMEKIGMDY